MAVIFSYALLGIALLLLVPVVVLLVEILASLFPGKEATPATADAPRLAVLVPAHDEAAVIGETLRNVAAELAPGDRLIVVADNCTDATASIAQSYGAEVVSRNDLSHSGKSFALDFGIRHLSTAPPEVVVFVDADCLLDEGSLRTIAARAWQAGRPVQAYYEILLPPGQHSAGRGIAVFATKVKNYLRPLGLHRLGLPCQLAGTGMAVPWETLTAVDLKSGELAEDLVLGLDLARLGFAAEFCAQARVTSYFPPSAEGTKTQRARWETGHVTTILRRVPALIWEAILTRNVQLLALALDAAVPPLALQAVALLAIFIASLAGGTQGFHGALAVSAVAIVLFFISVILAWHRAGRDSVTFLQLAAVPVYVLTKLPLYAQILSGKRISWIRSKRD